MGAKTKAVSAIALAALFLAGCAWIAGVVIFHSIPLSETTTIFATIKNDIRESALGANRHDGGADDSGGIFHGRAHADFGGHAIVVDDFSLHAAVSRRPGGIIRKNEFGKALDGWGNPLLLARNGAYFSVASAGPDRVFSPKTALFWFFQSMKAGTSRKTGKTRASRSLSG